MRSRPTFTCAFKRSSESPASLASGKYGGQDVVEALLRDFLGKCYLCEVKISARELSIDHRKHKSLFPELECSWDNLFPTCRDCNDRRPKKFPPAGLLDPAGDDIESRLGQTVRSSTPTGDERPHFQSTDPSDARAAATAVELDRLHNTRSIKAVKLRAAITERINEVVQAIVDFERQGVTTGPVRKVVEEKLRELFSRRAPFTALVRGRLGAGFEHLFD
jgi:hypothetical protein